MFSLILKYFFKVKQEECTTPNIGEKKIYASSLSDANVGTKSKNRPFTATNKKHEIQLPQRKLPLGAIPSYMRKCVKRPVCIESNNKVKSKYSSASSFQDNMTKVKKFNLKNETVSNILVGDETRVSKDQLSRDSVKIAVADFLLDLKEVTHILSCYLFHKHFF